MTRSSIPSRLVLAGPAALLLAACAVPGIGGAYGRDAKAPVPPFDCALTAVRSGPMVDISGTLTARDGIAGRYRLSLGHSGASGGALVDQAGDFVARAGEEITLGQISLSAGAGLTGALAIDWPGGTVTCPLAGL